MIWRERLVLLIVLGVLLVANTIFFFTYRVQYQSRLEALDTRLEESRRELEEARSARVRAERNFQSYRQVEKDVQRIFDDYWSTQPKRLTLMIAEVKRLATASNLTPASYSFSYSDVKPTSVPGNRRRTQSVGANELGVTFAVRGTYQQIRRLINLLELSRQFIIIEHIGLTAAEGDELSLSLKLRTLFRDDLAERTNDRL